MNMRKIIAVLAAVLMLCTLLPMAAVSAAPGDVIINKNFDDGSYFTNGSNENGYMVFNATSADWANVYMYANNIKSGTKYVITFDCKADKATNINVKINNNWKGDTFKWTTNVTTEWATYTCVINPDELAELTATALLMFTSNTTAANGAIYHIDNVVVKEYRDPSLPTYTEDFEDGTLGNWSCSSGGTAELVSAADLPVANANGGNYAMKSVVESGKYPYLADSKAVTVEPNTDYVVSVDVLHATNNWPIQIIMGGTSWLSNAIYKSDAVNVTNAAWTNLTFVFNTGSATTVYMGIKSTYASATFYVDNYTLSKANPANVGTTDGYIYNGNFETGKGTPWSLANGSEVVADPTGSGQGYVVKTNENAGSGAAMFSQTMNNLKANTNYKLSFKVYGYTTAVSNAAFYITFPKTVTDWSVSTSFGTQKPKDYIVRVDVKTSLNAWYPVSVTFNTGDLTAVLLSMQNYRANGGQYYFDDFKVMEVKEPTSDGYLLNGNFETGDLQGWTSTSCDVVESPKQAGDYAVHVAGSTGSYATALGQTVTVEPNTQYAIAYWYTLVDTSKNIRLYVHDGADKKNTLISAANGGSQPCLYGKDTAASNGVWKMSTMSFNSGEQTSLYLKIGGGSSGYAECYMDSIIMWKVNPASNDGYIVNGDFETGTTEGVKTASQTYVSPEAAKDGNFGLYMINSKGNWGGVGSWTVSNLEAGATYKIEWDMKAVSKGFNWTLWQDNSDSGVKYDKGYFSTTEWTHFEKEFVSNTSTLYFNINGGNTGVSEEVYLDNLKITLVKSAHTCEFVGTQTQAPTCTEDGVMTYACSCGEGTYTESIPALGHKYESAETKAPTCGEAGIKTYTCACGASYTEEIPATGAHEFFYDCDAICMNCYQEVREASHNVIHVEAKAPTCTAEGNLEYWYCDVCGAAWLDEACTLNTNLRAVKLPTLEAVASIGDELYASLADALADAANGEIVLLADIELDAPIVIEKGQIVTLDLNGYSVVYNSTTQNEAMITNKGTLTINDSIGTGVINYNYTGAADPSYGKGNYTISNAGNLTVNGGKITIANLRQHAKYPIDNNSTTGNAVLVINGGHLYNYNTSAIRQFCNSTTYENSITINGGLIEGYCAIWVQNPGKNTVNAQLTIAGGEIKSTASAYVNGTADLKDVSSAIYCTTAGGAWDENSLVSITGGVINENVYLADSAPDSLNVEGEAIFNGYVELPCAHEYFTPCDKICMICGEETNPDAAHNVIHVEAVAPTCTTMGNIEYWYCDVCGAAWLDEACTLNTNLKSVKLSASCSYGAVYTAAKDATCYEPGNVEYWYCANCDVYYADAACTIITNAKNVVLPIAHNVIHVAAKAATHTELGNIEYWYCDVCGQAWLDELCHQNTNLKAVILPTLEYILPTADVDVLGPTTITGEHMVFDLLGNQAQKFVTVDAPFNMQITMEFTALDNAEQVAAGGYGSYNTDFFIKFTGITDGSFVGNGCYLAGQYSSFSDQWVVIPLDGFTVENGVVYPMISAFAPFTYEDICEFVKNFKCGIYLTDEILAQYPELNVELSLGLSETVDAALSGNFIEVSKYEYTAADLDVCFHNVIHVAAKAATCDELGNIEYWYCDACGAAWLDEACTLNTNLKAVILPIAHNVIHVDAKAATCTENGNIEYWYCADCGQAWLDDLCHLNTNLKAVILPATDHAYDNEFDTDCNNCGEIREVEIELPVENGGCSIREDEDEIVGLAAKFDIEVEGLAIKEGKYTQADYTNAYIGGYKLITMGVIASNGISEVDIPIKYLLTLDDGSASYAARIINIPEDKLDVEITFQSYFVIEVDGVEVTVYGTVQTNSYNGVLNG